MAILRRTAFLVAALVSASSIGFGAIPANAATPRAGEILCGGDVCLQTISVNTSNHTAQVNGWANTSTLNPGFFILTSPPNASGVSTSAVSPVKTWPAGGTHFTFTIPLAGGAYEMSGYRGSPPGTNVGNEFFGINF